MAHIAIFCDGTWNSADAGNKTHVARLAQACAQSDEQTVLYFEGVGTGRGMMSDLGRWISKIGGGLFGWGLNANIKAAYLALCEIHQPGDKIMIFGFSRGAYTARSLAGMIRKCGILAEPSRRNVDRAFRLYRKRGRRNLPDAPHIRAKRRKLSPHFATSPEDVIRRNDHSYLVRIAYLGVWDTAGALGIPKSVLGRLANLWNALYAFHDTSLSRLVEAARHAVALDEKRVLFEPSLWNNLQMPGAWPGLNNGDTTDERPYQQQWFAGHHSVVGGSDPLQGLASLPLEWVWQGASLGGLKLAGDQRIPETPADPLQIAPGMVTPSGLYKFFPWLLQWRRGPAASHELHVSARQRASTIARYRPHTLAVVLPELFKRHAKAGS